MDDFDIPELEIRSLREPTTRHGAPEEDGADTPQAENVNGVVVAPHGIHVSTRTATRWRRIRSVIVGVCVVSVLALLLARSPETPAILGTMLGIETPTPTVPLILGMDTIYPMFSVPWGTLRIDGHVQTSLVQTGQDHPIRLSRGRHVLEYRAALFPTLQCTLSVPAADADTCPQEDTSNFSYDPVPTSMHGFARVIDLGAKPERLPADQRAALVAAIDSALRGGSTYQTTVIPGERYAVAPNKIAVSSQVLTATLTVKPLQQPSSIAGRITLSALPCADICVDLLPGDSDASSWKLTFAVSIGWRYATADGHIVAETPLPAPQGPDAGSNMVTQAWVKWEDDHWAVQYVGVNYVNAVCGLAYQLISNLYEDLLSAHETNKNGSASSRTYVALHEADGCYVTYHINGGDEPEAGFLFRLGVLLAVNADAQHLFPALHVADAHDRDIVSHMRALGQP
ncbi:MAG: hypothetical protein ACXVDF_23025 [Ktedonobacterales bacterium]